MTPPDTNGWSRAEMFVIHELQRLSAAVEANGESLANLRVEVARKGAIWGAIAGAIVGVVGFLLRK